MGWRIKQASSEDDDGPDWTPSSLQDHSLLPMKRERDHPQRQSATTTAVSSSDQVKCPRCGSTDTKFCYYNNYNKSQPRHFCKACKRHWTKGGTLRNVPVGGGRKNKRPRAKTSPSTTSVTTSDTSSVGERVDDERKQQKLIFPQLSPHLEATFHSASSAADHSVLQEFDDQFPWSGSSPFEVSSWQHPILTGATTMPMGPTCLQPWTFSSDFPETAGNSMNWDELDTLVSANLNIPWDDVDIKLP